MNNNRLFGNSNYQDMDFFNEMIMQNNLNNNYNQMNNSYIQNNVKDDILGSYEGYIKGNMFKDLYDQYKNYKPSRLIPNNEQAELLLNLNQTAFAAHDIRLYLDIYPEDKNMIKLFNDYIQKKNIALEEYEKKYGPVLANTMSQNNIFSWETYSWPWEMEEM